jgi:hypothetical protein
MRGGGDDSVEPGHGCDRQQYAGQIKFQPGPIFDLTIWPPTPAELRTTSPLKEAQRPGPGDRPAPR